MRLIRVKLGDSLEASVILEVKGYEDEQDRSKNQAVRRWVDAVNHHGGFGVWVLAECRSPYSLPKVLEKSKKGALAIPEDRKSECACPAASQQVGDL